MITCISHVVFERVMGNFCENTCNKGQIITLTKAVVARAMAVLPDHLMFNRARAVMTMSLPHPT